jgi:signal transduction histidine kinase
MQRDPGPPRGVALDGIGSWLLAGVLAAMTLISLGTSWRLYEAYRERERTATASLESYARFAANTFLISANSEILDWRHFIIQGPIEKATGDRRALIPFDRFVDSTVTNIRNTGFEGTDPLMGYLRLERPTGRYVGSGSAAEPDVRAFVLTAVSRVEYPYPNLPVPFYHAGVVRGEQVFLMAYPQRAPDNSELALFGVVLARRSAWEVGGRRAVARLPVLPPFAPASPFLPNMGALADSLLAVQVVDVGSGSVLFESRPAFAGTIAGEARSFAPPLEVRARVTLSPNMVARYRESVGLAHPLVLPLGAPGPDGTLQGIRVPLEWFLPAFSLLLAVAAAFQLRRERGLLRARRDFVASVSHELRTPLAQIRMFTETLQLRRERDDEERTRWLGIISREARRLGDLVENILLFSHVDAERIRLEKERTDLGELIEETVEAFVPLAAERGMRILADAPSRIYCLVDPRAMRQVVVNLLDNALKYGPRGQTVTVELERTGSVARLMVSDQGPGIPAGERSRMWQPFVRLGPGVGTTGGSGIGLSVVRALVEQHGATITVTDAPGGGARFTIELAAEPPADTRRAPPAADPAGSEA